MRISCFQKTTAAICLTMSFSTIGCATSSFLKSPAAILKAPMELISQRDYSQSISKILCLWEAAEGQDVDGTPSRGFAGQILFFEHGRPSPVKVKGEVVISLYKDYDVNADEHHLISTFKFDAKAWSVHLAEGSLGESYNVFVPFSENHNDRVTCALRAEVTLENGGKISSPYSEVILGGKQRSVSAAQHKAFIKNRQTGGSKPQPAVKPPVQSAREALNTMTIQLPRN